MAPLPHAICDNGGDLRNAMAPLPHATLRGRGEPSHASGSSTPSLNSKGG